MPEQLKKSLQIFRTGKHTAMDGRVWEFTEADIDASIRAYDPALHEAPLVVGHPRHDFPAYGWVRALKQAGAAIEAEPHQVQPAFAEMVNSGAFKKISASWYPPGHAQNPVPEVFYLKHVGFLGAAPPAVKGMRDANFAADDTGCVVVEFADDGIGSGLMARFFRSLREFVIDKFGAEEADKLVPEVLAEQADAAARRQITDPLAEAGAIPAQEPAMPSFAENALTRRLSALVDAQDDDRSAVIARMATAAGIEPATVNNILTGNIEVPPRERLQGFARVLGVSLDELVRLVPAQRREEVDMSEAAEKLAAREAAIAAREESLKLAEAKAHRQEITEFCDRLEQEGRLLPKDKPALVEFMAAQDASGEIEFAEGDATVKKPGAEWLRGFLAALPEQVDFAERGGAGDDDAAAAASFAAPNGYTVSPERLALHQKALAYQQAKDCDYVTAVQAVSH